MKKWNNYFSGKRVWITGASGGIGRAMVEALGAAGVDVVASDIREDQMADLAERFDSVRTLPMDITDSAAVDEKATRTWDLLGSVDVLINNAGVSQRSLFAETDPAVLRRIVEVNLIGTMEVTRAVVARMLAGNGGHLVTITSMAAANHVLGRKNGPARTFRQPARRGGTQGDCGDSGRAGDGSYRNQRPRNDSERGCVRNNRSQSGCGNAAGRVRREDPEWRRCPSARVHRRHGSETPAGRRTPKVSTKPLFQADRQGEGQRQVIDPHIHCRLHAGLPAGSAVPRASALSNAPDPILILVADKDTVVLAGDSNVRFPTPGAFPAGPAADIIGGCSPCHEIAIWQGRPVYALAADSKDLDRLDGTGDLKREDFRTLYLSISEVELGLLGRAIQIIDWYATSRYCSACGTPTTVSERESVARCPDCGHDQYPRLAPAMIVAVVRDGQLLLARSPRFRAEFHSVLAGFVEPGETAEECVRREVFEEAGIQVKNVRYFGSQSWPFPHSLMLGFTAEWAAGELQIDEEELVHADWYAADEMPTVPSEISISGRLIAWFRETYG